MNKWFRQIHRWLSVAFTLLVATNFVANALPLDPQLTMGLGFLTLVPLFLLMATGLYLFVLPYTAGGRSPPAAS